MKRPKAWGVVLLMPTVWVGRVAEVQGMDRPYALGPRRSSAMLKRPMVDPAEKTQSVSQPCGKAEVAVRPCGKCPGRGSAILKRFKACFDPGETDFRRTSVSYPPNDPY